MSGLQKGDLGPYAQLNWSGLCNDSIDWFCKAHGLGSDRQQLAKVDEYWDEANMPAGEETIFLALTTHASVEGRNRDWRVKALAKRIPSSSYYYLFRIVVEDVSPSRDKPKRLYAADFQFEEYTTRSIVSKAEGALPNHQYAMAVA